MSSLQTTESVNSIGTDWTQIGPCAHAVQFYEHDEALSELVAAYVGTALVKGHAAIVVATQKHRDDLKASLAERGMNVAIAQSHGRYEELDAADTLRLITTSDGWPDRDKFMRLVTSTITRVTQTVRKEKPQLAAFGEMVAMLCSSGHFAAAIRLEELWNELAHDFSFSLCCAYPMSLFKANEAAAARFMKVCAQHSHVFPAERRSINQRDRSLFL